MNVDADHFLQFTVRLSAHRLLPIAFIFTSILNEYWMKFCVDILFQICWIMFYFLLMCTIIQYESVDFRQIFQFELRDYYGGFNIYLENEVPEMKQTHIWLLIINDLFLATCRRLWFILTSFSIESHEVSSGDFFLSWEILWENDLLLVMAVLLFWLDADYPTRIHLKVIHLWGITIVITTHEITSVVQLSEPFNSYL